MWQYSSKGIVAGIAGNVDMDYFYEDDSTPDTGAETTNAADDWSKAKCKDDAAKWGKVYTVNCNTLYFRKGAGTDQAPIKVLKRGTKVTWYGYYTERGGITWLFVALPDGTTGFVSKGYLKA